ncbi:cupin domain-containing protein [Sesbania bispinosa]|nr:cupin domain-containing protein [Sesbania bispinosa]
MRLVGWRWRCKISGSTNCQLRGNEPNQSLPSVSSIRALLHVAPFNFSVIISTTSRILLLNNNHSHQFCTVTFQASKYTHSITNRES